VCVCVCVCVCVGVCVCVWVCVAGGGVSPQALDYQKSKVNESNNCVVSVARRCSVKRWGDLLLNSNSSLTD
jgi:hypothetical protein